MVLPPTVEQGNEWETVRRTEYVKTQHIFRKQQHLTKKEKKKENISNSTFHKTQHKKMQHFNPWSHQTQQTFGKETVISDEGKVGQHFLFVIQNPSPKWQFDVIYFTGCVPLSIALEIVVCSEMFCSLNCCCILTLRATTACALDTNKTGAC